MTVWTSACSTERHIRSATNGCISGEFMMKRIQTLLLLALMGMALAPMASASVFSVFTNRGDWNVAMNNIGASMFTETFDDGLVNQTGLSVDSQWGGSVGAFQYNDRVSSRSGLGSAPSGLPSPWVTTWTLSGLTRGFGGTFDLSPGGAGEGIGVWGDLGAGYELLLTVPRTAASEFWGFTSGTIFHSVQFRGGGNPLGIAETYRIDDLSYGNVPEPTSIILLGTCMLGVAGIIRRRRAS